MPPTRMQSACRVRLHAHMSGTGATEGMPAGCTPPDVGVAAEEGVAVAVDLGVGDEEAGGMAVGEADGDELPPEDVLLDGGGAQAEGGGGLGDAEESVRGGGIVGVQRWRILSVKRVPD